MDGDQQFSSASEAGGFIGFKDSAMRLIAPIGRDSGHPTAFIGPAIDGVGDCESGRFLVGDGPPEFDGVGHGRIVLRRSFDGKLFDNKSALADEARAAIHQVGISQCFEAKAGDVGQRRFRPNAHDAAGLEIAAAEQRAILLFFKFGREILPVSRIENGPNRFGGRHAFFPGIHSFIEVGGGLHRFVFEFGDLCLYRFAQARLFGGRHFDECFVVII